MSLFSNFVNIGEEFDGLINILHMKHCLYIQDQIYHIDVGEEKTVHQKQLYVNMKFLSVTEDTLIIKIDFRNKSEEPIHLKLFVWNYLANPDNSYAFISPKQDVVFLTNEHGLYLSSGILNEKSIIQYGVVKDHQLEHISNGNIPFCPLGSGNVASVFSLEQTIQPKEFTSAYTWTVSSSIMCEKELLDRDKRLKTTLAFSGKR